MFLKLNGPNLLLVVRLLSEKKYLNQLNCTLLLPTALSKLGEKKLKYNRHLSFKKDLSLIRAGWV